MDQALALLAECTASQPRLCKLHGVCLIDCILNPPSDSGVEQGRRKAHKSASVGELSLVMFRVEGQQGA